jgi:hypothetical protein
MITAIHRKNFIPLLALLLALAGMTLSVIGEASSHGVAELSESVPQDHDNHSHSHDDFDETSDIHLHHDAGSHTHESVDRLTVPLDSRPLSSFRQLTPYAGDSPRNFCYRLDRPPKASLIV